MRIAAVCLILAVSPSYALECIDITGVSIDPIATSQSAECKYERFQHSFISIRVPGMTAPLPHCSDMPYAACLVNGDAICSDAQRANREEFVAAGCLAAAETILSDKDTEDCIRSHVDTDLRSIMTQGFQTVVNSGLIGSMQRDIWKRSLPEYVKNFMRSPEGGKIIREEYRQMAMRLSKRASIALLESHGDETGARELLARQLHDLEYSRIDQAPETTRTFAEEYHGRLAVGADLFASFLLESAFKITRSDIVTAKSFFVDSARAVASYYGTYRTCLDQNTRTFHAIRCAPTLLPSVGYNPPIIADRMVEGAAPCGTFFLKKKILEHPAIIRKAVEEMLPYFQPRGFDYREGIKGYYRSVVADMSTRVATLGWLKPSDKALPDMCTNMQQEAICWIFSRCVRKQASLIVREIADRPLRLTDSTDSTGMVTVTVAAEVDP